VILRKLLGRHVVHRQDEWNAWSYWSDKGRTVQELSAGCCAPGAARNPPHRVLQASLAGGDGRDRDIISPGQLGQKFVGIDARAGWVAIWESHIECDPKRHPE
jgi:hypothetical protein